MDLATLAHLMMLTPAQAVALPATLDCAADKVSMTRDELVARCVSDGRVRDFLANTCRSVA